MFSPIGIAYRSDLVKTPPRSWKDLWDSPELKGKVGLYQIDNTAGYSFLMMTSKVYGSGPFDFDTGFRQIERLKPFPQAALAGAMAVLLSRGEILAGPLDIGETLSLKKKGLPVAWAAPSEGMFMFDQTFNLLKNGPNKDAAYAFLDYMLSEDVQTKLALEFQGVPVNRNVKLPPASAEEQPLSVNDLDKIEAFDWVAANKLRDVVTERWNRVTR
jgi:putative spermidine/putrescine transport system substrate-binding protein